MLIIILMLTCEAKYTQIEDFDSTTSISDWKDVVSDFFLPFCQKDKDSLSLGTQSSQSPIHWERTYILNYFSNIDLYIEYSVSGVWNDQFLYIYANDVLIYKNLISLIDINRSCDQNFLYESYVYVFDLQVLDKLKLEIKTTKANQGFYLQKIVLNTRIQAGRNSIIPFVSEIQSCNQGLEFVQYYCKCPKEASVYQVDECKTSCDANFLYDAQTNECYKKQNCDQCTDQLNCNPGFYKYHGNDPTTSDCLSRCPGDYYSDKNTMECLNMKDYLSANENNGYPVDHYFFFKETADFFHFHTLNEIFIQLSSIPRKAQERSVIYRDKFVAGSYETFQSQQLILTVKVKVPQYKLKFIAVGHFIDFIPSKLDISINGVSHQIGQYIVSPVNELEDAQDYIMYIDVTQTRVALETIEYNQIIITVEQAADYRGRFYLEDINIYTFHCKTECSSCFSISYCSPCQNPANKNPDCTCMNGYYQQGDVCQGNYQSYIACLPVCSTCNQSDGCIECKPHRINPPLCDTCTDQYFLSSGDCQPCIIGCQKCSEANSCLTCLTGYFKNLSGECLSDCGDGFFQDTNSQQCLQCPQNCLQCDQQHCNKCSDGLILINYNCYYCPQGNYLQGTDCLKCIANCSICQSNICQQCQDTYYYQVEVNQCVKQCNQNEFSNILTKTCDLCDSSCLSCNNNTINDCLDCPPGKLLNTSDGLSGNCQPACLLGYYKKDNYCQKCWIGCKSCVNSTQQCNVCAKDYYRFQEDYFCYEVCPDGFFNNNYGQICSKCHSQCKTCYGSLEINCLSCFSPLNLSQNSCILHCPDGQVSNNGKCQACPEYCESCIHPNECTKCNAGFFFLKNQCYAQCPQAYFAVSNICQCQFDYCQECPNLYYNNECLDQCPSDTFTSQSFCYDCNQVCLTCSGQTINECTSCLSPLKLFNNECVPECFGSFYHEESSNKCLPCNENCQRCSGPNINDCITCYFPLFLTTRGLCMEECLSDEYLIISERQCKKCHPECLTCFSDSNQSCLTCLNYFYLFTCIDTCPIYFTPKTCEQPQIDVQCTQQCVTCQSSPRFCKQCIGNRVNPPMCDCDLGYFDNGYDSDCQQCSNKCFACTKYSDNCILCKGDRILPNCDCPKYHYDDGSSKNCIKCDDTCETCSIEGCITCLNNRINPPSCICPDGYYEAYELYCQKCATQCQTCEYSNEFCSTCSDIRENPPQCNCPKGYYEDQYLFCRKCNETCIECDLYGCLTCFGNRIGPIDGQCLCLFDRQKIGSLLCTDCQLGIPYFELNDELNGFYYDFGGQITIIQLPQSDLCNSLFESETVQLLGTDPICDESSVLFGKDAAIKIDDPLYLKKNLQLVGCQEKFESILQSSLQLRKSFSSNKHKPYIKFKQVNSNICSPTTISFYQQRYFGNRELEIQKWEIIDTENVDQEIQQIVETSSTNILEFPPKTLIADTQYTIELTLSNFLGIQNNFLLQFTTTAYPEIIISRLNVDQILRRYEEIQLTFDVQYFYCFGQSNSTLFYDITLNNRRVIQSGNFSEIFENGQKHEVLLKFEPYFFNQTRQVITVASQIEGAYGKVANSQEFEILLTQFIPQLQIQGGNQTISYLDDFSLNATIIDPDNLDNYTCFWGCIDIVNLTKCVDQFGQEIQFNQECQQHIKGKTLAPYTQICFTASIAKNGISYYSQSYVQMIEFESQQLAVKYTQFVQNEIIYQLTYPESNPDILHYACEIIYDNQKRDSFAFYYPQFKMKLNDHLMNLSEALGDAVQIRISVFEEKYILPSIIQLKLPLPIHSCSLKMENEIVEFLDTINLEIVNCSSQNLFYSIHLASLSAYKNAIEKSNFYNTLLISPLQTKNKFSFTLPHLNQREHILIVQIQGQVKNLTSLVTVKKFDNISALNFKEYLRKQTNLDQQLIGYRLVAERLSKIQSLEEFKESFYTKLINLDENQTFLSNQTEILYHSIAVMVIQNASLIFLNQPLLYTKLSTRIMEAAQELRSLSKLLKSNQLTSQQNGQMESYKHQCYSFLSILAADPKYQDKINTIENLIELLQSIQIPNEPIQHFEMRLANYKFGILTPKFLNQTIGTSLSESNQINSFSMTHFKGNSFYEQEYMFPKINKNAGFTLKPLKFQFQIPNQTAKISCISQINQYEWNSQICQTRKKENHIICECNYMLPTSIIQNEEQQQIIQNLVPLGNQELQQMTSTFIIYISISAVWILLPILSIFVSMKSRMRESPIKMSWLYIASSHQVLSLFVTQNDFIMTMLRGLIWYTVTIETFLAVSILGILDTDVVSLAIICGLSVGKTIVQAILKILIDYPNLGCKFFGLVLLFGYVFFTQYLFWNEILIYDQNDDLFYSFIYVLIIDNTVVEFVILTIQCSFYLRSMKQYSFLYEFSKNEQEIGLLNERISRQNV